MARPPLELDRFARDAAADNEGGRERRLLRSGAAALDLRQCVAARDEEGIRLLLCRAGRTAPELYALVVILADLLNASLGYAVTPEAVAEVGKIKSAARESAA